MEPKVSMISINVPQSKIKINLFSFPRTKVAGQASAYITGGNVKPKPASHLGFVAQDVNYHWSTTKRPLLQQPQWERPMRPSSLAPVNKNSILIRSHSNGQGGKHK